MKTDKQLAEDARFALHGRILRCLLGGNPSDCPLYDLRKRPLAERIEWLESKTDEEVTELYTKHRDCLEHKQASDA